MNNERCRLSAELRATFKSLNAARSATLMRASLKAHRGTFHRAFPFARIIYHLLLVERALIKHGVEMKTTAEAATSSIALGRS